MQFGRCAITCFLGVWFAPLALAGEPKLELSLQLPPRTQSIVSFAVSANGGHLISGPHSMTAILWSLTEGKPIQTFLQATKYDPLMSVTVSADGKHVVTGSYDSAILWDTRNGKKLQTYRDENDHPFSGVRSLALSEDGKNVFAGLGNWKAIRWELATGKLLQTFPGHKSGVVTISLSPDATRLVTGSSDNSAALWDVTGAKKLQAFQGHSTHVTSVALSTDGKQFVTGAFDNTAVLWDAANGKRLQVFQGHEQTVWCVALSKDGRRVVTGSSDDTAAIWEVNAGKKLQTFRGHKAKITSIALSADDKHLWTASNDGSIRLWDTATGKERCQIYSFDDGKQWLVVTPEGYFDGSEGAHGYVAYRMPGSTKLVDDDATRRRFHRVGLLAHVWKGKK